jgi:alpha-2-macroglobulin
MRITATLCCLLLFITSSSQNSLIKSRQSSTHKFIYRITPKQAAELYQSNLYKAADKYLTQFVDSFIVEKDIPKLASGNYLVVHAKGNRLHYQLHTVDELYYKLINNNRDLVVLLHDKMGNSINNASVFINNKRIPFDDATKTYRINKRKKIGTIAVYHNNVFHFFPLVKKMRHNTLWYTLKRHFPVKTLISVINNIKYDNDRYYNFFRQLTDHEKKHRGFLVFNKPKYKPLDTVFWKAYVMNKRGQGIDRKLILRLSSPYFDIDTVLAEIKPYRKGGYESYFVLSDSLDLDLDEDYLLTLEELSSRKYNVNNYTGDLDDDEYAMKRKVLMRGNFSFEEYELNTTKFFARTDKKDHYRGTPVSLYMKATDENDLAVMDGRVDVVIKTSEYSSKKFDAPKVYLPDTLWKHSLALEPAGETKLNIPDSIFPAAGFSYDIVCIFRNSNNEYDSKNLYQTFHNTSHQITFTEVKDSLLIDHIFNNASVPVTAIIYELNESDDTLASYVKQLPTTVKANPVVASYKVTISNANETYMPKKGRGLVSAIGIRTKDSIAVQLINPKKLPVWYTIFANKKTVYRGYNDSMFYSAKVRTPKNYFVSLQYIYGDKVFTEDYTVVFQGKLLNVKLDAPAFVYPGQKTPINIVVSDAVGKPVANADITALAYTSKFENATTPSIPYLGKIYKGRKKIPAFYSAKKEDYTYDGKLDWQRWSREMHLDSIEYYKFLSPLQLYINSEPAKDSITQIAPFIVINGDIQPIHLLYIDEKPVFFSQSQDLQRYSFKVNEGKHSFRLRTHSLQVTLNDFYVPKGLKTFVSINADTANKRIQLQKMPDTLTAHEKRLWSKYMILLENNFREYYAYVEQDDKLYLLNAGSRWNPYSSMPILIGPLSNSYTNLRVKNGVEQSFEAEGAYQYHIEKGLIKQKQLKHPYPFSSFLSHNAPQYNFADFVLTEKEVDSLWQNYLDHRSANEDLFQNSYLSKPGNGKLQLNVGKDAEGKEVFVKNIILFRYDDPDFARIYKGITRDLGYVQPGKYRLFLLLKDDTYFMKDSVMVKPDGINYYETGTIIPKKKDSISTKISEVIKSRDRYWRSVTEEDMNRIKESFNSGYLDHSNFTRTVTGKITDDKGSPVAFATIMIKGTKVGTRTDANGNFSINTPENATLVTSAAGYVSYEARVADNPYLSLTMRQAKQHLSEVVVTTAYSVKRKSNQLAASVSVVNADQLLSGKVAGVQMRIRGAATVDGNNPPLIIVDGLPYTGDLSKLDTAAIADMNVLKPEEATTIYGAAAVNGVVIITTKKSSGTIVTDAVSDANTLRRNFRDHAFWQPRLVTDANGKASFSISFPDDITAWRTQVLAVADKKRTGYTEQFIKSFKAISAQLSLPQFAVEGDSINVIGKALNYLPDSLTAKRSFTLNDEAQKENVVRFRNSWIDTFLVTAAAKDSMKLKYTIQKEDGYFDGEERSIPVLKTGVLETKGFFTALDTDTSFRLSFDPALGKIKLYAEASLLPVLLDEIETIRNYEYLCNEQLASKLKALILQKRITEYLKTGFNGEKNIREIISKLDQNKNKNLWGWWVNNEPVPWISLHVAEALLLAEQSGYKINLNKQLLTDYLVFNMESYNGFNKLLSLHLLQTINAKVDYKRYIDSLEKKPAETLYETLRLAELKQKAGVPVLLDTLIPKHKNTLFGNWYWGEESYRFFDNSIQNTLLMYRLLKKAGGYEKDLRKVRNYFLEKRKDGKWRNTYESALILETILPDVLVKDSLPKPATITVTTNETETVKTFPYQKEINNGAAITVSKNGDLPVYFTAYQQQWNKQPQKQSNGFEVKTWFSNQNQTVSYLKGGEPVLLKAEVVVKGDADYVMIEIPIPAGCSYKDKTPSRANNEVHREHFKNKVSIFCTSLKQGTYTFTVSLLPRYSGRYHLNPAKAEMMYFPVFYGREGMKKVKID